MTDFKHILITLEYSEEDKREVIKVIGTLRRLMLLKRSILESKLGILADEIMEVEEWYQAFMRDESL